MREVGWESVGELALWALEVYNISITSVNFRGRRLKDLLNSYTRLRDWALPKVDLPVIPNIGYSELSTLPCTSICVDYTFSGVLFLRSLSQQIRTVLHTLERILTASSRSVRRFSPRIHILFQLVPSGGDALLTTPHEY